jgi:hypothetical protein
MQPRAQLASTLLVLVTLGGIAGASPPPTADVMLAGGSSGSFRGVNDDYLVLPDGGELTGQMKFVTSAPSLGGQPLSFSDLALFGLATRWSILRKLELSANVDLLPKQPSYTSEKPWQSAGFGLRGALGPHAAVALSVAGGHLVDHAGAWVRESLTVQYRHPIHEILSFDLHGGVDGISLTDAGARGAFVGEAAIQTNALFHSDHGEWGGWIGMGYAVPVVHSGIDPTTQMSLDPRPRLDFHVGTVLSLVQEWDLFVDYAVIDRGDLSNPATRLPILDGGFDQRQILFGVTRHVHERSHPDAE